MYRYRLGWEKHLFRIGAEKDTTTKNSHHTPLPRAHLHLVAPRRDLLRVHLGAWASREGGIKYNLPRWAFTLLQAVTGCFFSQSLLLLAVGLVRLWTEHPVPARPQRTLPQCCAAMRARLVGRHAAVVLEMSSEFMQKQSVEADEQAADGVFFGLQFLGSRGRCQSSSLSRVPCTVC